MDSLSELWHPLRRRVPYHTCWSCPSRSSRRCLAEWLPPMLSRGTRRAGRQAPAASPGAPRPVSPRPAPASCDAWPGRRQVQRRPAADRASAIPSAVEDAGAAASSTAGRSARTLNHPRQLPATAELQLAARPSYDIRRRPALTVHAGHRASSGTDPEWDDHRSRLSALRMASISTRCWSTRTRHALRCGEQSRQ